MSLSGDQLRIMAIMNIQVIIGQMQRVTGQEQIQESEVWRMLDRMRSEFDRMMLERERAELDKDGEKGSVTL